MPSTTQTYVCPEAVSFLDVFQTIWNNYMITLHFKGHKYPKTTSFFFWSGGDVFCFFNLLEFNAHKNRINSTNWNPM